MEKGRRGLAGVEVGSSGEVVAPWEKQETGFTKPEVLGGRKEGRRQVRGQDSTARQPFNQGQFLATPGHQLPV